MHKVLNRVLLGLLLATLLVYWRLVSGLFATERSAELLAMTLIHLALMMLAIIGLWRQRPWGYYAVYLLVPVSTILLSISFVPFVADLLPRVSDTLALPVLNGAVLLLAAAAHSAQRRSQITPVNA